MRRCIPVLALIAVVALGPTLVRADQATANRVAEALRASGQLSDYSIGVKFEDGTATLMGRVASEQQMKRAIQLACDLPYVQGVVNQLEVGAGKSAKAGGAVHAAQQIGSDAEAGEVDLAAAHRERIPHPFRGFRSPAGDPKNLQRQPPRIATRSGTKLAVNDADQNAGVTEIETTNPGDPLKQSAVLTQATSTSRRFAEEPLTLSPPAAAANAAPRASVPVQTVAARPMPAGCPCPSPMAPALPTMGYGGAAAYDHPHMPNHAWPSYAAYPNYAAVTYPKQYSPTAWPYIGPFYPYPQVPLGWRKVTLEWDDGWWFVSFKDKHRHH